MTPYNYDKTLSIRSTTVCGYLFFVDKDHPLAYKSNHRVYLHRHIASIKLGRWLTKEEHVHHIDGNRKNNSPENLLIVDSVSHGLIHAKDYAKERTCKECGAKYLFTHHRSKSYCSKECSNKRKKTKIIWPSPEEIHKMIWRKPTRDVAKDLGISDKAIEKFCKKHGLSKPPKGYWQKKLSF